MDITKLIKTTYEDNGFPAATKLLQLVKLKNPKITPAQIKDFLAKQETSQLHKRIPKTKKGAVSITTSLPNKNHQIDLIDMQKYNTKLGNNNGMAWIYVEIDVFTRKAHCVAIHNKTTTETLRALQECIKILGQPIDITSDEGPEFMGEFQKFLDD